MTTKNKLRFSLGQIVAAPGAIDALKRTNTNPADLLKRHATGDWGAVPEEDKTFNEAALGNGARLMSAYFLSDETKVWVITEAEDDSGRRQTTTLLLPEEY